MPPSKTRELTDGTTILKVLLKLQWKKRTSWIYLKLETLTGKEWPWKKCGAYQWSSVFFGKRATSSFSIILFWTKTRRMIFLQAMDSILIIPCVLKSRHRAMWRKIKFLLLSCSLTGFCQNKASSFILQVVSKWANQFFLPVLSSRFYSFFTQGRNYGKMSKLPHACTSKAAYRNKTTPAGGIFPEKNINICFATLMS